jgi:hypothetical protein
MLMVAVRVGNRALPLTWLMRKTAGALERFPVVGNRKGFPRG